MDKKFEQEVRENIQRLGANPEYWKKSLDWMIAVGIGGNYSYNFAWMGLPIIQYPQDMVAVQELIWQVKPDLVIETGIARGGSLILSASMLALLDLTEAIENKTSLEPWKSNRKVIGLDIEIRPHNRAAIEAHPMSSRIQMIEGSSVAPEVVEAVKSAAQGYQRVLVMLDSNHTHEHVLAELQAYAPLVGRDSYCIVFDTVIDDTPSELIENRPWGVGNNPKTAMYQYLQSTDRFVVDEAIHQKLLITVARQGYLKCIKD